ncbi:unnamed protein product [Ceutorhynchus assimilis]|uniref:ATP-dependent DNA helicase n=1 Tax=Ceutorhynchus assimilis TaxID=467358 RepID=A0A9N9MWT3_9CUCU|nr:unnamed protein product [Ceutorhynchus assimilis]
MSLYKFVGANINIPKLKNLEQDIRVTRETNKSKKLPPSLEIKILKVTEQQLLDIKKVTQNCTTQKQYETNHPGIRSERRLRPWTKKVLSGLEYDPGIAYEHYISAMNLKCQRCNALKWKGEAPGMCCSSGKVQLTAIQRPPEPLHSLLMGDHSDHTHFIDRVRQYNGCFQMTSFGAKQIVEDGFMPTFKVQGQVYHLHGSLLPESERNAQFLQIHFVSEDEKEASIRCSNYPGVKLELVHLLQKMLHNNNRYIKDFNTTIDKIRPNVESFQVVIHADRMPADGHRRLYNAPTASEVGLAATGNSKRRRRISQEDTSDDGGFTVDIKSMNLDNRWVVPYNPVLLRTFNAHINVEITSSVKSIKYICKYITKSDDQAAFALENKEQIDEIEMYENGRYLSSSEAVWRILCFSVHERYPTVTHLDVHLENGQRVYFTENNIADKLTIPPTTTLLAFFELCQVDNFAKTLLYAEVPSYYVWQNKRFIRRKRGEDVEGWPGVKKDSALGRVYTIHPNNIECFYLRLLLHHMRGPTSYSYLKTVDNILHHTFQSACKALGLLEDDKQWDSTLGEAAMSRSLFKLRELFSIMLIFCHLADAIGLWEKYKDSLAEDLKYQMSRHLDFENTVLSLGGKNLQEYGLPQPNRSEDVVQNREYMAETNYNLDKLRETVSVGEASLTDEQRMVCQEVVNSVRSSSGKMFFLDAPGRTGKTFLINCLLAKTSMCYISKQSNMAKVLQECKLIIWDESPMSHKSGFEALNNSLKDLQNSSDFMGGVTALLAGDFRQTLPVVSRGMRANEVKAYIKASYLWPETTKLSLTKNMRVHLKGC